MFEDLLERLKQQYNDGLTQKEMARRAGCSNQYISQLLSGLQPVSKMSLEMMAKLFPDAVICLDGDAGIHHNTNSQVIQGNGNTVQVGGKDESAAAFLRRIMASPDIDPATKVKLYQMLEA